MSEVMSFEECVKKLKVTRDFGLYLDLLDRVKDRYLVIVCIKGPVDNNAHAEPLEKLVSMGFSKYSAEPVKKYAGIMNKGQIICDDLSEFYAEPQLLEKEISGTSIRISFRHGDFEIRVNGEDFTFGESELHIIIHDCEKSETIDASDYEAFEKKPGFFHHNFRYSDQYIKEHIYMPKKYMKRITTPSMKRSFFSDRELGVKEVENGIVLPKKTEIDKAYGGVCDESFNFIAGNRLFDEEQDKDLRHFSESYTVPPEELCFLDETVLYGGHMSNHPGHLVVENFANKIWWLVKNDDGRIKIAVSVESPYTVWEDKNKRSSVYAFFIKDFFAAMGIPEERIIFVERPTKFRRVIVPDQCLVNYIQLHPYEFTAEYIQVFQQIKNRITPSKYKKVYFAKTKTPQQNMIGEEYFIDFFEKKGFKIVYPEDHTLKEQAEFLYGADEAVMLEGTPPLWAVFCKPGTRLTVLGRTFAGYGAGRYSAPQNFINEASEVEFFLVNVSATFVNVFSDEINDPSFYSDIGGTNLFLLCVTEEFKRYVKDVFNEELDITPEESLRGILYDYLARIPKYFAKNRRGFASVKNIKVADIIENISEVFFREDFDTSALNMDIITDEDMLRDRLELSLKENRSISNKLRLMADKAKELIDENTALRQHIARLEAENDLLRSGGGDDGIMQRSLAEVGDAEERLSELYRRMDELTKQLLQAMEENEVLRVYAAGQERE